MGYHGVVYLFDHASYLERVVPAMRQLWQSGEHPELVDLRTRRTGIAWDGDLSSSGGPHNGPDWEPLQLRFAELVRTHCLGPAVLLPKRVGYAGALGDFPRWPRR